MDFKFFNERQIEEIQMMAEIVNAMAIADGFSSLDSCLGKHPNRLDTYTRYASSALRAVRDVQGFRMQIFIDDADDFEQKFSGSRKDEIKS